MSLFRPLLIASTLALASGCASGLNSQQTAELEYYEARNLAVIEKSPGTGAALGLLPGGGSFYGRSYGLGVVNLLFWPLSILWDPVSGYDASQRINYTATRVHLEKLRQRDFDELQRLADNGALDGATLARKRQDVETKYRYTPLNKKKPIDDRPGPPRPTGRPGPRVDVSPTSPAGNPGGGPHWLAASAACCASSALASTASGSDEAPSMPRPECRRSAAPEQSATPDSSPSSAA